MSGRHYLALGVALIAPSAVFGPSLGLAVVGLLGVGAICWGLIQNSTSGVSVS